VSFKGFHGLSARVSPFHGTLHRNGRGLEVQFLCGGGKGENKESRGDGESKHREEKQTEKTEGGNNENRRERENREERKGREPREQEEGLRAKIMGNNKRERSLTSIYPTLPKRSLTSSKEFFFKKLLTTKQEGFL